MPYLMGVPFSLKKLLAIPAFSSPDAAGLPFTPGTSSSVVTGDNFADQWSNIFPIYVGIHGSGFTDVAQLHYTPAGFSTITYNVGTADCTVVSDTFMWFKLPDHSPYTAPTTGDVWVTRSDAFASNHLTYNRWNPGTGNGSEVCTLFLDCVYPDTGYVAGSPGYWLSRTTATGAATVNGVQGTGTSGVSTPYGLAADGGGLKVYKNGGGILISGDFGSATYATMADVFGSDRGTLSFVTKISGPGAFWSSGKHDADFMPGKSPAIFISNDGPGYGFQGQIFHGGITSDGSNYRYTPYVENGTLPGDICTVVVRWLNGTSFDISVNGSAFALNSVSLASGFYTTWIGATFGGNPLVDPITMISPTNPTMYAVVFHSTFVANDYADKFYKWARSRRYLP